MYTLKGKKVLVAGHRGMVGQALVRRLAHEDCDLLTMPRETVDLRRQCEVEDCMAQLRPQLVFLAAAKVGGVLANATYPAEFLYDNLMIEANIIEAARRVDVQKLVFLGSSCIYPKDAPQPIPESALMTGPLEPTNEWYAIAKVAGIKLTQSYRRQYGCDFISAQPTNLFGPGDNFDLASSHVLPALIRKAHEAKITGFPTITVWGSGAPKREFMHVDCLADALIFLVENYSDEEMVNVGSGEELTIRELAETVCAIVGFTGELVFDPSKPDGTPRKRLDLSRLSGLGWTSHRNLREEIASTYTWFRDNWDVKGCSA